MLDNLVVHANRRSGRQRKTDSFIAAAARNDRRVNPDHLAGQINQRPARVSRIDGCVGLQESLELVPDSAAILGADDSRGHRGLQTKRAADCEHPVAHLHAVGVSKLRRRQFLVRFNLDYRQVRIFIDAHDLRRIVRRVPVQLHLDFRRLLYHMVVGQDVPALVHDYTGTKTALRLRRSVLSPIEETVEEILHRVVLIVGLRAALLRLFTLQHLRGRNVHDRGFHAIDNGCE